jgi:predicted nucleic acid-binding protein
MNQDNLVIDTDFLLALILPEEPNHLKAVNIWQKSNFGIIFAINLIKYEALTVLSRKLSQLEAITYFDLIDWTAINYIFVDEDLEKKALEIYRNQNRKNISTVDCTILALAKQLNCKIASFDQFYPKEFLLS